MSRPGLFLLIFLIPSPAIGQAFDDLIFETRFIDAGIMHNPVTGMVQDDQGFLWVGTITGLYRYDGKEFISFNQSPVDSTSLADPYINKGGLYLSGDTLWIGTRSGLQRLLLSTLSYDLFIAPEEFLGAGVFNVIGVHAFSNELLVASGAGLFLFNHKTEQFTPFEFNSRDQAGVRVSVTAVISSLVDENERIWLGTDAGVWRCYKSLQCTKEPIEFREIATEVWSLAMSGQHTLLVGTLSGHILSYDLATTSSSVFEYTSDSPLCASCIVTTIYPLQDGTALAGMYDKGLFSLDVNNRTAIRVDNPGNNSGLASPMVFFKDAGGLLWLGTWAGLAKKQTTPLFESHHLPEANNNFRALYVENDSTIWLGNLEGDIYTFLINRTDSGISKSFTHWGSLDSGINSLHATDDYVFAATKLNPFYWMNKNSPDSGFIPLDEVIGGYKVFIDSQARFWGGSIVSGLYFGTPGQPLQKYQFAKANAASVSSNQVMEIFEDVDGEMWLGTIDGGVNRVLFSEDQKSIVGFEPAQFAPETGTTSANDVLSMYQDENGLFWIGTLGAGLIRYDTSAQKITQYGSEAGLEDPHVSCIVQDKFGELWLGTRKGLYQFDIESGTAIGFYQEDGLPHLAINTGACGKTTEGLLFWGTEDGFFYFNPPPLIESQPPNVQLTAVEVGGEPYNGDQNISYLENLNLKYNDNFLTFHLAALDYYQPEKNQIEIRLEGGVDEWVNLRADRSFNFAFQGAGTYHLWARASNSFANWSAEQKLLTITIKRPVWFRGWFITLVIMVLGAPFIIIYVNRINRKKEAENLRKRIASDLHDDIGTKIGGIVPVLDTLSQKSTLNERDRSQLDEQVAIVQEIGDDIREIVWLNKRDTCQLSELLERMEDYARSVSAGRTLSWEVHVIDDPVLHFSKKRNILLIFKEAMFNAIRHADASTLGVVVRQKNKLYQFIIADDGCGFDLEGTNPGNGLVNMRRRAEGIHAQLSIESAEKKGTRIEITLKLV